MNISLGGAPPASWAKNPGPSGSWSGCPDPLLASGLEQELELPRAESWLGLRVRDGVEHL